MKQRLFLYRIDVVANHISVNQRIQLAPGVIAHPANPNLALRDFAVMGAQVAEYAVFASRFIKLCFHEVFRDMCEHLLPRRIKTSLRPTPNISLKCTSVRFYVTLDVEISAE